MVNLLERAQEVIQKRLSPGPVSLQKSTFTTSDLTTGGGLLAPQQSRKLIQMILFPPTFLRQCRLVPMRGPTDRIDRITFGSRILHAAEENTELATSLHALPSMSKLELSAKLFKCVIPLSYESLQDSIEGGQNVRGNVFEDTVFSLIAERLAIDIEEILMISDSSNAGLHNDLQQLDGWLKLARDQNTYDHGGSALSKNMYKQLHLLLPKQYRRSKTQLLFIQSPNADVEWTDELGDRGGTTMSDSAIWGSKGFGLPAYGVKTYVCGAMPEESGASSNLGQILHTHPKNAIAGIWRNIFMEVDKDVLAGRLIIVCSVRLDAQYEQVEGSAVATDVKVA